MKKLIKIASLLACVSLVGCNGNKTADPVTPPEKKINISELPTFVVGETIDLKNYVSCEGGKGDFYVTFAEDSDFAGYMDATRQTFSASHSGTVNFTVKYSGETKEGSVQIVSQEYVDFLEETKNVGWEYGVYFLDSHLQNFIGYNNYAENFYIDWFTQEGYVESNGAIYTFTLSGTEEEPVIEYSLTGNEPDNMAEYSMPFMFNASNLKSVYVPEETVDGKTYEAYESIVCDDLETMYTFTTAILGYPSYIFEYYGWTPTYIELAPEILSDSEGNEYPAWDAYMLMNYEDEETGDIEEGLFDLVIFDFGEGCYVDMDELSALFEEQKPHGQDISETVEKFDAALAGHNFTVEYSADWYSVDEETGERTALGDNPFVYEGADGLSTMINHYLNKIGSISAYVTETQTYVENEDAAHSYGLVYNEGVYIYEGENHEAIQISSSDSIFADELRSEKANYMFMTSSDDEESPLEMAFVNYTEDLESSTFFFTFNAQTAGELFENLFMAALPIPEAIEDIKDDIEYLAQFNNFSHVADIIMFGGTVPLTKYLTVEAYATFDGQDLVELTLDFVWEDYDEENEAAYDYIMSVTFTDFGTTEIPEGIVVDYSAE